MEAGFYRERSEPGIGRGIMLRQRWVRIAGVVLIGS